MKTMAPNDAVSESAVISIALSGSTTVRKAKKSTTNMTAATRASIQPARARRPEAKSCSAAACP